ncbi:hypothetical protein [Streptomyces sp. Rer75]|uniref:hypothetical protein n=1 Tax=Streptomyces sp. Rer75 TaxID=2750011 RepID=UPI0015D003F1|nr:hypothetical protein [Streptomyces sp. Rer75]QLH23675.1 hypothetical protein HYQ63_26160 [Streptomyces sp. Rer75]
MARHVTLHRFSTSRNITIFVSDALVNQQQFVSADGQPCQQQVTAMSCTNMGGAQKAKKKRSHSQMLL